MDDQKRDGKREERASATESHNKRNPGYEGIYVFYTGRNVKTHFKVFQHANARGKFKHDLAASRAYDHKIRTRLHRAPNPVEITVQ